MNVRCRIEMFGGLRVRQDEREITRFSTERTAAVLACLAYHLGQPQSREALAEYGWPDRDPHRARTSLNTALSSLRRQLEPPGVPSGTVVQGDRLTVRLNPPAVTTDVQEFGEALLRARRADSSAARAECLADAVRVYAGELLPGLYDDWVRDEQTLLANCYFEAAAQLAGLLAQSGDVRRALEVAREAVSRDRLREDAHAELMRLLAASGNPAAALRQYRELQTILRAQLEDEPSPELEELAREIRARAPREAGLLRTPEPGWGLAGAPAPGGLATPRRSQREAPPSEAAGRPNGGRGLTSGTVTLLLTDVEEAGALFERMGEAFRKVLQTYCDLLSGECRRHGGEEVAPAGESFTVLFAGATQAAACAIACQKALAAQHWPPETGAPRVRIALFTGDIPPSVGAARDVVLRQAAQVRDAAHGGQILCSEATAALLKRDPPPGVQLEDLGSYRLRDMAAPERLFQVSHPDRVILRFPPPRAQKAYAGELPLELSRFFGRERELEELVPLLTSPGQRLVTLTGPGGSGKTRLAKEVARRVTAEFGGAVWFVPLADLRDAKLVPGAIADAVWLQRTPEVEPLDQLALALGELHPLLVLDNLEQFGADAGPLVLSVLDRVRSATCLATSRRTLDLPGERLYLVAPLPTPPVEGAPQELSTCPSVRLLVDRAQEAKPDFQLTAGNAGAIATLVRRLEGIPLAIELAAARSQAFSPGQMLAHLDRRFGFLVSRRQVRESRHRTLRAAIEWSCDLLEPEPRGFFYGLAVFRGGWTLEAAEAVCRQPKALEYLEQLREASLIQAEQTDLGPRFGMLDTLREFGLAQLGEAELAALRQGHGAYFLQLAERAEREFLGPAETEWMDRLEADHDNLRSALDHAAQAKDGAERELRLSGALWQFWSARGHQLEGEGRIASALRRRDAAPVAIRAKALHGGGFLAWLCGDRPKATSLLEEALQLFRASGDVVGTAETLASLGRVLFFCDGERSAARLTEAVAIARQSGCDRVLGRLLVWLGGSALFGHEEGLAEALLLEGLAVTQKAGDGQGVARALRSLGELAGQRGDLVAAEHLYGEALALVREARNPVSTAQILTVLAEVHVSLDRYLQAEACLVEAVAIARTHAIPVLGLALDALRLVCTALGEHDRAHLLATEVAAWHQASRHSHEGMDTASDLPDVYPSLPTTFRFATPEALWGWQTGGLGYRFGVDTAEALSGTGCLRMLGYPGRPEGSFGVAVRGMPAGDLGGKRLRYAGYVRTDGVRSGVAGLWLRVDGPAAAETLLLDNMLDRGPAGTTDWSPYEIVVAVPEAAASIWFGALLTGIGTAWFDALTLEVVE